jgi:hypothetical protein
MRQAAGLSSITSLYPAFRTFLFSISFHYNTDCATQSLENFGEKYLFALG